MKIDSISKNFGKQDIIKNFSLEVPEKSITCIIGPSGCGKTTLLNIISGLIKPNEGRVSFSEEEKQGISYLFQEPRLLPWFNVLENVKLVLNGDENKAREILEKVGLGSSLSKYPQELSGGMKQRVAMARAFAFPSNVLLMDEPFQNLDAKLKKDLLDVFLNLWNTTQNKTVLWVTHDITESCLVSNTIICVSKSPMKVNRTFQISIPRKERTAENTAALQAQIYQTLIV